MRASSTTLHSLVTAICSSSRSEASDVALVAERVWCLYGLQRAHPVGPVSLAPDSHPLLGSRRFWASCNVHRRARAGVAARRILDGSRDRSPVLRARADRLSQLCHKLSVHPSDDVARRWPGDDRVLTDRRRRALLAVELGGD